MKILYGVQGTGNGHLTRARAMAPALAKRGVSVDWIFSGRDKSDFFDMQAFGDFRCCRGLTLQVHKGKVSIGKTIASSHFRQLRRDIHALNVRDYNLVVTDFEPVSAWAARLAGVPSIGISHQNAFHYPIPKRANNPLIQQLMRYFAPVQQAVGVHWHHFGQPLLPPIVEPSHQAVSRVPDKILVYLPFQPLQGIIELLKPVANCDFYIYHKESDGGTQGRLHFRRFSREGFQRDLHSCEGVISSAGFELPSEALQLGKKLLVEPLAGQMEQQSNALALDKLGLASTSRRLTPSQVAAWLQRPSPAAIHYPDVAAALAAWIASGCAQDLPQLSRDLWQQVEGMSTATRRESAQACRPVAIS